MPSCVAEAVERKSPPDSKNTGGKSAIKAFHDLKMGMLNKKYIFK